MNRKSKFDRCCLTISMTSLMLLSIAPITWGAQAKAKTLLGKVTNVTLYRGEALVTRSVEDKGKRGTREIIISNLPAQIKPESLFCEGDDNVEIRAVRYRSRAVKTEPREEIRKLNVEIQAAADQLNAIIKMQQYLANQSRYLDKLENFVASTAKTDLSKGVLNAESLEKMSAYSSTQRKKIMQEQLIAEKQHRELKQQLQLLQRKLSELTSNSSKTIREAMIFVRKDGDKKATIKLNYLVRGCGWSPSYTLKANNGREKVRVEYNALIHQLTGEDWSGVKLTLSTASPALSSAGPGLAPFHVSLVSWSLPQSKKMPAEPGERSGKPANRYNIQMTDPAVLTKQLKDLRTRQRAAAEKYGNASKLSENLKENWTVNTVANDFQSLELSNPESQLKMNKGIQTSEEVSIDYQLAGPVSLASRRDQQMVRILRKEFKSNFYHIATPMLSSYVYREAELLNDSDSDLLAGPVTVYLDGRFVGRSEIPTVTRGELFLVGFGADPQLRTKRHLVNKTDKVQGGNRELMFKYQLSIENYKGKEVAVRVLDRLPYSQKTADVRTALLKLEDELSKDKTYLRTERPKGILRWDIKVAAKATGEQHRVINYGYTVEFDRNFQLSSAGSAAQFQQEFDQLQKARRKK